MERSEGSVDVSPHAHTPQKNPDRCPGEEGKKSRSKGDARLARDWFPSRRSVESQYGALVVRLLGHCRLGRWMAGYGLYFVEGSALNQEAEREGASVNNGAREVRGRRSRQRGSEGGCWSRREESLGLWAKKPPLREEADELDLQHGHDGR